MEFKTVPWSHQKTDVLKIYNENRKFFALFYDMGAGKTKTMVDIMRGVFSKNGRALKTLIVCPGVVLENWKREIATHSHIDINLVQVVDGLINLKGRPVKNALLKYKIAQLKDESKQIFVINTEMARSDELMGIIYRIGIELLVVDESHNFKSYNSKQTKMIHKLTKQPQLEYRFILTGSPQLQDSLDLWPQFYILNPDIVGRNFFTFRETYFYDENAGMPSRIHFPSWVPKDRGYYDKLGIPYQDNTADLNRIIYQHASRVMKDDVLDLPPLVQQTIEVPFSKEQGRIYNEMRDNLVAYLESKKPIQEASFKTLFDGPMMTDMIDDSMTADLAIVKMIRLMQICGGVFVKETGEVVLLETEREKELIKCLESITANKENKVIIWTTLAPTYALIARACAQLKLKYVFLTGLQNKHEKQANIDDFNSNPSTQVMIANQSAGGTGVNLTAANYYIYYMRSFNLGHDVQSEARAHRGGQTRKVTRIDLVTPDTVDSRAKDALTAKKKKADDTLAPRKFGHSEILSLI